VAQAIQERLGKDAQTTNRLDVIAHGTIREGKLEGFKRHAAELIMQAKEKDTKTLRYDWFISSDGTEFEVLEAVDPRPPQHVPRPLHRLSRTCGRTYHLAGLQGSLKHGGL
jgi:ATP phosphoribosyltransferase regulatory subunit HisZ